MKNYFDQQQELKAALLRLQTLEDKRQLYFNKTQPGAIQYSGEMVEGGVHKNPIEEYIEKISQIDEEIEVLRSEIEILDAYLKKMEKCLRSMKGVHEKIFVAKYIDNLNVTQIMHRVNYSQSDIYRKLGEIRKMIKE